MDGKRQDYIAKRNGKAMTHKGTVTLETERLILRRFTESDADFMFRNWASDPEAPKYMTWNVHDDVAETKGVLSDWISSYNSSDYYHWAIELKEIGEVIGSIGCESVNNDIKSVHMGYCIGSKFWHKGYMTEVLKAVIDFLFDQAGVNRIEARHDPLNPHSGGVMRKAGMTYEGTMRQNMMVKERLCDSAYYAILAEDYICEHGNNNPHYS
jgi:ribosomal-protein-alanine N-acetyltransferase